MPGRESLKRMIPLALVACVLACTSYEGGTQNTGTGVERIVAVGDVHGDYDQFVTTLRAAGIVNRELEWIGGTTHLVQTGDVLDRWPDSRKVMDLLMRLEQEAPRHGGAVHALIGNHEAMAMAGDRRYVHEGEIAAFGSEEQYRQAMSERGTYGKWLRRHNAVIKINDTIFCHGGLSPAYAGTSLARINRDVRAHLGEGSKEGPAMASSGPCWYRGLAQGDEAQVRAEVSKTLARHGATRIVIGHTISKGGIAVRAGGRVIMIDVGMSRYFGGPAACLVIDKSGFHAISPGSDVRLDVGSPGEVKKAA